MKNTLIRYSSICSICLRNVNYSKEAIISPFIAHRAFDMKPFKISKDWKLREIEKGTSYFPSHSVFCKKCNFLFSSLRFNGSQLASIYNNYRKNSYNKLRRSYEKNYISRSDDLKKGYAYLQDIERYIKKFIKKKIISVLDWGGDTGKNTPFKNNLKKHHIYDISDVKTISKAKKISKSVVKNNNYDLVVCAHVLEHIPDLNLFLKEIKLCLKKNTIIYFEVPFEREMQNKKRFEFPNKRHWHEHINFFSCLAIKNLLKNNKYKVLNVKNLKVKDWKGTEVNLISALARI